MIAVSFVAMGAIIDMRGVPRNAISNAFFSGPDGRRERRDGTMKSHHHQNPRAFIEISLHRRGKAHLTSN